MVFRISFIIHFLTSDRSTSWLLNNGPPLKWLWKKFDNRGILPTRACGQKTFVLHFCLGFLPKKCLIIEKTSIMHQFITRGPIFSSVPVGIYHIRGNITPAIYWIFKGFNHFFFHFTPWKGVIFGKKVALYSKWRSNQEWHSITADTVFKGNS